jgi:hypothetical protein
MFLRRTLPSSSFSISVSSCAPLAGPAVAGLDGNAVIVEPIEPRRRRRGQRLDHLDAVDVRAEFGEQRGLIPAIGAGLEHRVAGLDLQQVRHQRRDERLRRVLIHVDRERRILVGIGRQWRGDELVPRHLAHGSEHAGVDLLDAGHLAGDERLG